MKNDYEPVDWQEQAWEPTPGHRERPADLWKKLMAAPYYGPKENVEVYLNKPEIKVWKSNW